MMEISRMIFALIPLALAATVFAELADDFNIPKGWRMQDRFHGFRYEAVVDDGCQFYAQAAQDVADELACFGWAQRTSANKFAGEARCPKATGAEMQERLRQGGPCEVVAFEAKDYADTKIRLHFSHFKILDEERMTCFRDAPHQCPEFSKKDPAAEACSGGGCEAAAPTDGGTATF
ncbi:unnamed protein product [Scytosiphon promiscuus]